MAGDPPAPSLEASQVKPSVDGEDGSTRICMETVSSTDNSSAPGSVCAGYPSTPDTSVGSPSEDIPACRSEQHVCVNCPATFSSEELYRYVHWDILQQYALELTFVKGAYQTKKMPPAHMRVLPCEIRAQGRPEPAPSHRTPSDRKDVCLPQSPMQCPEQAVLAKRQFRTARPTLRRGWVTQASDRMRTRASDRMRANAPRQGYVGYGVSRNSHGQTWSALHAACSRAGCVDRNHAIGAPDLQDEAGAES